MFKRNTTIKQGTRLFLIMLATVMLFGLAILTAPVAYADTTFTVTYDAGDGSFTGGGSTNAVQYRATTEYSHTSNVNDAGVQDGNYENNSNTTDVVTIPGATELQVTITYGTQPITFKSFKTTYNDWVCVWSGANPTYNAYSNYSSSVSGRLCNALGNSTGTTTQTYTITGDSVTFGFYSNSSGVGPGYGYYAVVSVADADAPYVVLSGAYEEPTPASLKEFTGWNTSADGSGDDVDPATLEDIRSNITLYAQYQSNGYEVIFDAGSETFLNGTSTNTVLYNTSGSVVSGTYEEPEPAAAPNRVFLEWNTAPDGSGDTVDVSELTESCTIYAVYADVYDVTYDAQAGTFAGGATTNTVTYYSSDYKSGILSGEYKVPSPNDTGTAFNAWKDSSHNTVNPDTLTAAATLYANYQEVIIGSGSWWKIRGNGELVIGTGSDFTIPINYASYIRPPWISYQNSIRTARFNGTVHANTSVSYMFADCSNLVSINWSGFDTASAVDMSYMFDNCSSLLNLDISSFNVSGVENIDGMFENCSSMTSVTLGTFETPLVTSFDSLFVNCAALTTINAASWDTSSVITLGSMFAGCSSLQTIPFNMWHANGFTMDAVEDVSYWFYECSSLASLDFSSLGQSKLVNLLWMDGTFYGCSALTTLDLSRWNVAPQHMGHAFAECAQLEQLYIPQFDTYDLITSADTSEMFLNTNNLKRVTVGQYFYFRNIVMPSPYGDSWRGWKNLTTGYVRRPQEFTNAYNIPGTWVWDDGPDENGVSEWTPIGSGCEWGIDTTGCLWIRPINGVSGSLQSAPVAGGFFNVLDVIEDYAAPWSGNEAINSVIVKPGVQDIYSAGNHSTNGVIESPPFGNGFLVVGTSSSSKSLCVPDGSEPLFGNLINCKTIDLSGADFTECLSTGGMFCDDNQLQRIIWPSGTKGSLSNVNNMADMFRGCIRLGNVDISGFDTENVVSMDSMFESCASLTSLDVSGFDTSKVTDMAYMFYGCYLTTLDVSNFNTSQVTTMAGMFAYNSFQTVGSGSAYSLNINGLDTSSVTTMEDMFKNCSRATSIDISGFDTSNVTNMNSMFCNCTRLTSAGTSSSCSLNYANIDTSKVTQMQNMFYGCSYLTSADVSSFDVMRVSSMHGMFYDCQSLQSLDLSSWNSMLGLGTQDVSAMFSGCTSLTSAGSGNEYALNLGTFMSCGSPANSTSNHNFSYLFAGDTGLTSVDLSQISTGNVSNMGNMFDGCSGLEVLDLSTMDTSAATSMDSMFKNCSSLESLDISNFDTSSATNMGDMFTNCSDLNTVMIGDDFAFNGNEISTDANKALLPTPSGDDYTGKWVLSGDESGNTAMTPAEIRTAGTIPSGTWVWQLQSNLAQIIFEPNGGICTAQNVYQEDTFTAVTVPEVTRPDYLLVEWNTANDGTGAAYQPDDTIMPVGGCTITLYAIWERDLRVIYSVNHYQQSVAVAGATFPGDYELAETETLKALPGTEVTPATKTYQYFQTPAATTITVESDGSSVVNYLYNYVPATIHYNKNGAETGMMPDQNTFQSVGATLSPNTFARIGYRFLSWNTEEDGSGTSYGDQQTIATIPVTTLTLYAQWIEIGSAPSPSEGVFEVTLHAGQSVTLAGLPAGTTYEIIESDLPAGWTIASESGTTGTIIAGQTSSAAVTNAYSINPVDVSITVHTMLQNGELEEGQFTFQMTSEETGDVYTAYNGVPDPSETLNNPDTGLSYPNPRYGQGAVTFDEIEFTAPGTYHFTVVEEPGTDPYIIYCNEAAGDVVNVTVTVVDQGGGNASYTVSYQSNGDNILSNEVFVNRQITPPDVYVGSGSLYFNAVTSNSFDWNDGNPVYTPVENSEGKTFVFTVYLYDENGAPLANDYIASFERADDDDWNALHASDSITSGSRIELPTSEIVMNADSLPAGTRVVIVPDEEDGYGFYSFSDGSMLDSIEWVVEDGVTKEITTVVAPTSTSSLGYGDLIVHNAISGNMADPNKEFEYTICITDENGNPCSGMTLMNSGTAGSEFMLDDDGCATFTLKGAETFEIDRLPEGYHYTVTQSDYAGDGYVLTITGNSSGTIAEGSNEMTFSNHYNAVIPNGVDIRIMSGVMLVICGLAALLVMKRRKNKTNAQA